MHDKQLEFNFKKAGKTLLQRNSTITHQGTHLNTTTNLNDFPDSLNAQKASEASKAIEALKFLFASNLSDLRPESTFQLDFKSRFLLNEIPSGHQV